MYTLVGVILFVLHSELVFRRQRAVLTETRRAIQDYDKKLSEIDQSMRVVRLEIRDASRNLIESLRIRANQLGGR